MNREIKKHFDFDDALSSHIVCLSSATVTNARAQEERPCLLPLMPQVPRIIDMTDIDGLHAIDYLWRPLPLMTLGEDTKTMDVDEFWHHLSTLEDFGGEKEFS